VHQECCWRALRRMPEWPGGGPVAGSPCAAGPCLDVKSPPVENNDDGVVGGERERGWLDGLMNGVICRSGLVRKYCSTLSWSF
jgi:hypothetical protein